MTSTRTKAAILSTGDYLAIHCECGESLQFSRQEYLSAAENTIQCPACAIVYTMRGWIVSRPRYRLDQDRPMTSTRKYRVWRELYYYNQPPYSAPVSGWETEADGDPIYFVDRDAAIRYIVETLGATQHDGVRWSLPGTYRLSHNEYAAPFWTIRPVRRNKSALRDMSTDR
jgi:hypothetical protein